MMGWRSVGDSWIWMKPHALPAPKPHEQQEWYRAGGDMLCVCGALYYDHPRDPEAPCLNVLCSGQRVKL